MCPENLRKGLKENYESLENFIRLCIDALDE
jgi:hypothetical protein